MEIRGKTLGKAIFQFRMGGRKAGFVPLCTQFQFSYGTGQVLMGFCKRPLTLFFCKPGEGEVEARSAGSASNLQSCSLIFN